MDHYYMDLAYQQALKALALDEVPIGAIVVCDHQFVGVGYNQKRKLQDALAHAEMLAIKAASAHRGSWLLADCSLYVTLEPCAMCVGAIVLSRLKRLVFGAYDQKSGACGSAFPLINQPYLNHRLEVTGGVLAEKNQKLLQDFFKEKRI